LLRCSSNSKTGNVGRFGYKSYQIDAILDATKAVVRSFAAHKLPSVDCFIFLATAAEPGLNTVPMISNEFLELDRWSFWWPTHHRHYKRITHDAVQYPNARMGRLLVGIFWHSCFNFARSEEQC